MGLCITQSVGESISLGIPPDRSRTSIEIKFLYQWRNPGAACRVHFEAPRAVEIMRDQTRRRERFHGQPQDHEAPKIQQPDLHKILTMEFEHVLLLLVPPNELLTRRISWVLRQVTNQRAQIFIIFPQGVTVTTELIAIRQAQEARRAALTHRRASAPRQQWPDQASKLRELAREATR